MKQKADAAMGRYMSSKWDETIDTLFIGTGFAGFTAGAEADKNGDMVLVLEKMPTYGGNLIIN